MEKNRKNRSGRNCDGAETTFKPISKGRVICNQTGVVLGRGKTGSYRRSRFNEAHTVPMPIHGVDPSGPPGVGKLVESSATSRFGSQPQSSLLTAEKDYSDNSARCPHCYTWNYSIFLGARRCFNCSERFKVI